MKAKPETSKLRQLLSEASAKDELDTMVRRPVTVYMSIEEIRETMLMQRTLLTTYAWAKAYCNSYEEMNK